MAKAKSPETLDILVSLGANGEPPSEFRIFSKGEVRTRKGQFLFDDAAAASVMKHAEEFGAEYPLDYGHSMLGGGMLGHVDPAEGHKAAGWFRPEVRDGELWATSVSWTPTAAKKLMDREYRYVSPAFLSTQITGEKGKGVRIAELINVALTNVPATKGLSPLVLSNSGDQEETGTSPEEEKRMTTPNFAMLAATVGLAATAGETEVQGRVRELADGERDLLRATGKNTFMEALGTIRGWQEGNAALGKVQEELSQLRTAARTQALDSLIESGKAAGKITSDALEKQCRDFGATSLDGVRALIEALPAVGGGKLASGATKEPEKDAAVLTAADYETAKLLGLSVEDMAKTRRDDNARKAG